MKNYYEKPVLQFNKIYRRVKPGSFIVPGVTYFERYNDPDASFDILRFRGDSQHDGVKVAEDDNIWVMDPLLTIHWAASTKTRLQLTDGRVLRPIREGEIATHMQKSNGLVYEAKDASWTWKAALQSYTHTFWIEDEGEPVSEENQREPSEVTKAAIQLVEALRAEAREDPED